MLEHSMSRDEEIAEMASDLVDLHVEMEKIKKEMDRTRYQHENLSSKSQGIVDKLKKCVGNNIPERNVVVKGKLVQIRQDGVAVKDYLTGK